MDRTVVFDTLYEVVVETLWREPDSVGKVYPRLTTRREAGASRETRKDVEAVSRDTIYIHEATEARENMSSDIRAPSTMSQLMPWLIIFAMVVIAVIVLAIKVVLK